MENYQFTIEVQAPSELEAKAKLNLLLQIGAFLKDFDAGKLTGAFLLYWILHEGGKLRAADNPFRTKQWVKPVSEQKP